MSLDFRPESSAPVRTVEDLLPYFRAGERRGQPRLVGLEHEKLVSFKGGFDPVPYEGPRGIRELLLRARRYGFELFLDEDQPIAGILGRQTLSLEPGGQVELSGEPSTSARGCAEEHLRHFARLKALGAELGLSFLGVGYRPFGTTATQPWMPKRRYALMRAYLPSRGRHALDMMLLTGSVQASLDFESEEDCGRKVRAAAGVSPLLAALYANSPIADGRDSGFLSFRYHLWRHVDPDRCGLLPFFFDEEGFTYRRYLEWALSAPMFFIRRHGKYLPMEGLSFARFLEEGARGETATFVDFEDHMTTLFPEIRVKQVLEVRSADACDLPISNALPAVLKGLLYDDGAREAATALTAKLSFAERLGLQEDVARRGLAAEIPSGVRVRDLCVELLGLAAAGLRRQGAVDEVELLEPLRGIAESGRTKAEGMLEAFRARGAAGVFDACVL